MRALLDVNVLIALLDSDHSFHGRAAEWFSTHAPSGWASCPITQNGCVRIMSHPGYPHALPVSAIVARLSEASRNRYHAFWADDVSLLDDARIDSKRIHGPRQLTDIYLVALAVRHGGCFVTFDHALTTTAVKDAGPTAVIRL